MVLGYGGREETDKRARRFGNLTFSQTNGAMLRVVNCLSLSDLVKFEIEAAWLTLCTYEVS